MSWTCLLCSSDNEDTNLRCYCDYDGESKESISDDRETTHAFEIERDINQRLSPKGIASNDTENSLFSFKGRIRRSTFWALIIPITLISMGLNLAITLSADRGASVGVALLALIIFTPATWVGLATCVKRCHDLNKSGWMVLTLFIPFVNLLIFLHLGLAPGTTGSNKYAEEIKTADKI